MAIGEKFLALCTVRKYSQHGWGVTVGSRSNYMHAACT